MSSLAVLAGLITCGIAAYTDWKKGIIPDVLSIVNIVLAVVIYRSELLRNGYLWWAFVLFVGLLVLALSGKFGGGDVKFLPSLALLTGQLFYLGLTVGLVCEILYGLFESKRSGVPFWVIRLPLAPFLFLGMVTSVIYLCASKLI